MPWNVEVSADIVAWPTRCNITIYTITWLMCAFSLVVDCDLSKDTHTDGVKSTSDHVRSFMPPKSFNKPFEFQYCIKQIDYIFPCVYCNRSQKTPCLVSYSFVLYTLDVIWCDLLQYTHTEHVIYLLNKRSKTCFCVFLCVIIILNCSLTVLFAVRVNITLNFL